MIKKYLKVLSKFVFFIAICSAHTPSQMSMYEPTVPEKLKKVK